SQTDPLQPAPEGRSFRGVGTAAALLGRAPCRVPIAALTLRTTAERNETMTSVDVSARTDAAPEVEPVDMKLEVVVLGVSDVDRAKAFYQKLGWRLDADFKKGDDFRGIQFTPHNSG